MSKSSFLAAVALATLVGACSQSGSSTADTVAEAAQAAEITNRAAEAARAAASELAAQQAANQAAAVAAAAESERLRIGIETALIQDVSAGGFNSAAQTVKAMRAIDTTNTPAEYRAAYVTHIQAWEDVARLKASWEAIDTDENNGIILVASVACAMLDCPATPIADRIEAEREYNRRLVVAQAQVTTSFREVERIAVSHGARMPA